MLRVCNEHRRDVDARLTRTSVTSRCRELLVSYPIRAGSIAFRRVYPLYPLAGRIPPIVARRLGVLYWGVNDPGE